MSATEVLEVPKSAKEAFENNPIAVVRTIEKQLRASSLRDKERLRVLVGGNYRDLLSTAEEIVTLDRSTKDAEAHISDLSRACKPPQQTESSRQISVSTSISAQLRLTIQCVSCASTALQVRSILLCAELTVIARLLLKSLADQQPIPKSIESLRNNASAVRRRLLRFIDQQFASPVSSIDALVQATCAYCLVTSASSGDAVKHFRHVRLERLRQRVGINKKEQAQIREVFQYLILSVQLLKSLLGRAVNDALGLLQKQPILQNQAILDLEALDTDRFQDLIPQDIFTFTPYINRVLLKQDEVQRISSDWVNEAGQVFEKGLREVLGETKSIEKVLALQTDLFSAVLPVYFSTPAQQPLLAIVREATIVRVFELCKLQIESLLKISRKMVSLDGITDTNSSLWVSSLVQRPLMPDSANYAQQVRTSHLGTKGELSSSTSKMRAWVKKITLLRSQFRALESKRWQDVLEEPDDDDEDAAREIIDQLSKTDPEQYSKAIETSLQDVMADFSQIIQTAVLRVISPNQNEGGSRDTSQIVYLIRVLRESSNILNQSISGINYNANDLAAQLHDALAQRVTAQVSASVNRSAPSIGLISSLPEDLPSPTVFALLRSICNIMSDAGGTDVWSSAAVAILKNKLRAEILDKEENSVPLLRDFDQRFMAAALSNTKHAAVTDASDTKSKATAYWQRTRLLFGVLS